MYSVLEKEATSENDERKWDDDGTGPHFKKFKTVDAPARRREHSHPFVGSNTCTFQPLFDD